MTINKLLVANRGEIAVRVIRAARDAGISSVAVYADSDAAALFVDLADEAFALNGATPAETYLNQAKLIEIANRHPRVNILRPGPGVGGHCIAVDPWFLAHGAPGAPIRHNRSLRVPLQTIDDHRALRPMHAAFNDRLRE